MSPPNEQTSMALTPRETGELALGHPIPAVVARFAYLREVLGKVMREGADYGRIPGCGDKDSLFKSGAEKLCTAFGLAPRLEIERRDLDGGHREYEVKCALVHIATDALVAEGVGCCSTMESRYRWRKGERTCPECGTSAIIRGRADYGGGWLCFAKKGGCGAKWPDGAADIESQAAGRVENPDIADTYNTVLKIAKKRAQVDATLTAVGASDLLTQDLEDIGPGDDEGRAQRDPAPRSRSAPTSTREAIHEPNEDWVISMIGKIDDAETAAELKKLAPVINEKTPRGSLSRKAVKAAYDAAMAKLV